MDQDFEFSSTPPARRKTTKAAASAPKQAKPRPPFNPPEEEVVTDQDVPEGAVATEKAQPKYSEEELAAIFDEIIFSGEYIEEVTIRDKLRIGFRTRTADEIRQITQVVDGTQAVYANTVESIRSLLQLQYALVSYQGKSLVGVKPEEKAKFIGQIPGPVVALLLQALSKFDEKVFAACQEGESNF